MAYIGIFVLAIIKLNDYIPGKPQHKKSLTDIVVAHNIPYVGQTTLIGNLQDMHENC